MGLFDALVSAVDVVVDVATAPIEVAKDVVTLGGELTDEDESYTGKRITKVVDGIEETVDEVLD